MHVLAHVTGMVGQELLARNEYLAAENRIIKAQFLRTHRALNQDKRIKPVSPVCTENFVRGYAARDSANLGQ